MARRKPKYQTKEKQEEGVYLKKKLSARSPNQKKYIKSIKNNILTFCDGPAGSGKTHIAVGCAIEALVSGQVDRIIITRPVVEAGEKIGYLPGDADKKLHPYLLPVFDELNYFVSHEQINNWKNQGKLVVAPIGLMRGRNFHNCFIIADECQNLSMKQLKMLLTRMGMESKLVITGDDTQSDLPYRQRGAFSKCLTRLDGVANLGVMYLKKEDIVRNPLIPIILDKLNDDNEGGL